MATTVSMPQLGETVTEGTILRWAKQVGDSISADEVLVEISTDKVDTEVPSPASGVVLEILVPEGETVEVGTAMAVIGEEGESTAGAGSDQAHPSPAAEASPEPSPPEPAPAPEPAAASAEPGPAAQAETPTEPAEPAPAAPAEEPAAASGASTTVSMPQLGETVTEGTILRWAKQVGDSIAADEVLVEISTDKVDTEVPSPASGVVLEILVPEGETVEVGTALAVIGAESGAASAAPAPSAPASAAAAEQAPEQPTSVPETAQVSAGRDDPAPAAPTGERRLLSPVVRRLIREHNIDVSQISGTGEGGRITRKDVESFIESGGSAAAPVAEPEVPAAAPAAVPSPPAAPAPAPTAAAPTPAAAPAPAAAAPAVSRAEPAPVPAGEESETLDLDRLRVRIGENMIRAKQTAAHVWTSVEVDYERVERVRQRHKEAFKSAEGFSLTYLPFIARATIDALQEYPVVNSSFYLEEKKAVFHRSVNLGMAIDLNQKGLVVASIRNSDGLRLVGIARQIKALADKAREGKLDPDDVSGSTFTITNPGPFGSFMSAPIINVPNTGILSTETVTKRPAVVIGVDGEDVIAIRHIGYLGLTWDHRAFDGSTAVLFLRRIKENLETWDWEQELA